jgi:hypothetical protein
MDTGFFPAGNNKSLLKRIPTIFKAINWDE